MAEKTIIELKKLFVVISNQYQEYKEVVGQLKHVLNDRGKTIMNYKLEIYTLKKDGYSGPPEDEEFFKICQAMQRKLLKRHTETYYKDFKCFERSLEKKFRMMDTELQQLQRISILWDEKQDPIENMSKIIKRKEMEITALKQEMSQLFKQKEQDRLQITTLEQESKPANDKILLLKRMNEKEKSIRRQIFVQLRQTKAECKELDAKLKILLEENNSLQEKYQNETTLHKNTKDHFKKLQRRFQQTLQDKDCLQGKYEKEKSKYKQTKESLEKTIDDLQLQLKETVKEHKCLERSHEKEKSAHKITKEALGQVIEEQERKTTSVKEELSQKLKELHRMFSENQALAKKEEELLAQLQKTAKEKQMLEEMYRQERIENKNRREELEQSTAKLQTQLQQADEQHRVMCKRVDQLEVDQQKDQRRSSSDKYRKELNQMGQNVQDLQGKLKQETEKSQILEKNYENEKSSHQKTQEELAQATHQNKEKAAKIQELQSQLQQAVKENKSAKEDYSKEMTAHENTKKQLSCLEEIYEKDKSERKSAKEKEESKEKAKDKQVKAGEGASNPLEDICQKIKSDLRRKTEKAEKPSEKKNDWLEINSRNESFGHKSSRKDLDLQLQRALEEKERLQKNHVSEKSGLQLQLQNALNELNQAKRQNKIMEAKLQETQLEGNGKNYQELHSRTLDRQFIQDLQACLSAMCDTKSLKQRLIAMRQHYVDNDQVQRGEAGKQEQEQQLDTGDLSKRLRGCENLLKVKSYAISRLEQKLSAIIQLCDEREGKYVQILNRHILRAQRLKKELAKSRPIPQKVSSWWHVKVLKTTSESPQEEEEQLKLYPEDWRLPDFPEYDQFLYS